MRFNFYYNSNNDNNDSKNSRVTQTSRSFRNKEYNAYLGKFQPKPKNVNVSVNKQKICIAFNMGRKIFHACEPYTFNATYPIRAVHFGGIIVFNNPYISLSPTNFLGGSFGDLMVLSSLDNKPVNSMFVSTYQTIADHLAHNVGSVLSYASLEIVLIDANNIVVGWGTTSTSNVDDTTNGIAGYEMTLSLFSFPEISNPSWIIGKGSSFSGLPSASQLPLFPFKELTI